MTSEGSHVIANAAEATKVPPSKAPGKPARETDLRVARTPTSVDDLPWKHMTSPHDGILAERTCPSSAGFQTQDLKSLSREVW